MKVCLLALLLIPLWAQAMHCTLKSHEALGKLVLSQIKKLDCPDNKKIHLTFDDGPHAQFTPQLLTELNRRNIKATFFISTTNITPAKTEQKKIVRSISEGGHLLASHGHQHRAYDLRFNAEGKPVDTPLTEEEREKEIGLSSQYLDEASGGRFSKQPLKLFRFPYGRGALPSDPELEEMERAGLIRFSSQDRKQRLKEYRSLSAPLHAIAEQGYGHLLWNHDSLDSTASAPKNNLESKVQYISNNLERFCKSGNQEIVALFHDIKSFNPEAVAVIIDVGECLGLKFVEAKAILSSEKLAANGTYIKGQKTLTPPLEKLEQIGKVLSATSCQEEPLKDDAKACYSQSLNRYFADCEGGAISICIEGKWYQRTEAKEAECRARGL